MTITEVIAGNKIPTEKHLISLMDLFGPNPKQLYLFLIFKDENFNPPLKICPPSRSVRLLPQSGPWLKLDPMASAERGEKGIEIFLGLLM